MMFPLSKTQDKARRREEQRRGKLFQFKHPGSYPPHWLLLWPLFCPALTPIALPNCSTASLKPFAHTSFQVQFLTVPVVYTLIRPLPLISSFLPDLVRRFAHLNILNGTILILRMMIQPILCVIPQKGACGKYDSIAHLFCAVRRG